MQHRQICLDTETTGVEPGKGDRIVEIGCVEIIDRKLSADPATMFHVYVNPERDVPEEAVKIHGLDNAFLAGKPVFGGVARDFVEYIRGAELIIHNAPFDAGFLNMELKRLGLGCLEDYCTCVFDSLAFARMKFIGSRANLDALCKRLDVDNTSRTLHGALLDAKLLADVYIAMTRSQG
ncbi:MAG: DNA polymerase III subunit epsilon, partial [Duodenibacillus sp.]|nr:DNA polymerase III subunit epsilon [Duodenibacillus sp.]